MRIPSVEESPRNSNQLRINQVIRPPGTATPPPRVLPPPAPERKRIHLSTLRRTGMKRRRPLADLVGFTNGFPERIDGYPGRLPSASDNLQRPPSGRRPCSAQEAGNPLSNKV
ncbi:unnamed protein product [Sphagnum tenellum]